MGNNIRENLIMRFNCAKCGGPLMLSYPDDSLKITEGSRSGHPTGAAVCYVTQLVEPCRTCINKLTGPAMMMRKAIMEMAAQEETK